MTDYAAIFLDLVAEVVANVRSPFTSTVSDYVPGELVARGHTEETLPVLPSKNHNSLVFELFPGQLILDDKLYIFPRIFEEGLITEQIEHDITIWNAGRASRTIESILGINTYGTELDHPAAPITLTPETDKTHTLRVLQDGPATQSAQYTYTRDNSTFVVLLITGHRIQIFAYECEWSSGVKLKYNFSTVMTRSDRFVEQRRALYATPRKSQTAAFWFDDLRLQQLYNDLKRFKSDGILAAPIYTEPLWPKTNPLLGESVIDFEEDFTDFYHLVADADMIIFFDSDRPDVAEAKEISSIDTVNKRITFSNVITKNFAHDTVRAFPAMLCASPVPKFTHRTDRLGQVSLTFEEL